MEINISIDTNKPWPIHIVWPIYKAQFDVLHLVFVLGNPCWEHKPCYWCAPAFNILCDFHKSDEERSQLERVKQQAQAAYDGYLKGLGKLPKENN